MNVSNSTNRRTIIGVMGSGDTRLAQPVRQLAYELGGLIAQAGAVLLCGGRGGIMEAVAHGAKDQHGSTIGILPGEFATGHVNDYIDCPIWTGLRDARNYVNVYASDAIIAMEGGPGTLSEIALAMKLQRPLVLLDAWHDLNRCRSIPHVPLATSTVGAIALAQSMLAKRPTENESPPGHYPPLPGQEKQRQQFEAFLASLD